MFLKLRKYSAQELLLYSISRIALFWKSTSGMCSLSHCECCLPDCACSCFFWCSFGNIKTYHGWKIWKEETFHLEVKWEKKISFFFFFFKFRSQNVQVWFGLNTLRSYSIHLQTSKDYFKSRNFSTLKVILKHWTFFFIYFQILPLSAINIIIWMQSTACALSSTKSHEYLCIASPRVVLKNLCFLMLSQFTI